MDFKKDYYDILGVTKQSSSQDITIAYRRLAKMYHPDRNNGDEKATAQFQLINEAYAVLGNKIHRQVYDQYFEYAEKLKRDAPYQTTPPTGQTKYKEVKKQKQTKVYLKGTCIAKYWAEAAAGAPVFTLREVDYKINPTDVRVTINAADIYHQDSIPQHYHRAYSGAGKFGITIKQPVKCTIVYDDHEEYYDLEINDILVRDPKIVDATKFENQSLGTLRADIYGSIVKTEEETVYEEVETGSGVTGNYETLKKNGSTYTRKEYYHKDFTTYWSDWEPTGKRRSRYSYNDKYSWLAWLMLLPFVLVAPWFFVGLGVVFLLAFLFGYLLSMSYRQFGNLVGILSVLLVLYFVKVGFTSLKNTRPLTIKHEKGYDTLNTTSEPVVVDNADGRRVQDERINHFLKWKSYDSTSYEGNFSILASQLNGSASYHAGMNQQVRTPDDISRIYSSLSDYDTVALQQVYQTFAEIGKQHHLDQRQFAEMVVSCVQSIPYYLVLESNCDAGLYSGDEFIQQYLAQCSRECCIGNRLYGVQSPVEFFGDLKGDCDTRSLLIYNILSHFNYDVAFLVSSYYKHAIVAVGLGGLNTQGLSLNINGNDYQCWETTSKGCRPGEINPDYSNLAYWQVALLNTKHI